MAQCVVYATREIQASRAWEWRGTSHRGHGQPINAVVYWHGQRNATARVSLFVRCSFTVPSLLVRGTLAVRSLMIG